MIVRQIELAVPGVGRSVDRQGLQDARGGGCSIGNDRRIAPNDQRGLLGRCGREVAGRFDDAGSRCQWAASELNTIAGTISIDGQGGFNTLTINDQNTTDPQTYTATSTSINRTGGPSVGYTNMQRVALNAGQGATRFTSAAPRRTH